MDYKVVDIIVRYIKKATYNDVFEDIKDLIHLLELYTVNSLPIDRALFKLFEKMLTQEKVLNKNKVAQAILSSELINSVIGETMYSSNIFRERSKLLYEMSLDNQENYALKESADKILEIEGELPPIPLDDLSLSKLTQLAKKGKKQECQRICQNYEYSLGSFFCEHIHCYSVNQYDLKCIHIWLELLEVITTYVDAKDFKECLAKSCPGCMMISLFLISRFCRPVDVPLVERILRNLLHDKEELLIKHGKVLQIGRDIFESKKPREDKFLGGNCLDIGLNNPLTHYLNNLGELACSEDFLKAIDTTQKRVILILTENASHMKKNDGYKKIIENINSVSNKG